MLHDNAPAHKAKIVHDVTYPPYSPDVAPSDYHLFRSMAHGLAEQQFKNFEEVKIWVDSWFASKQEKFFRDGIHKLPERWRNCIAFDGCYFE